MQYVVTYRKPTDVTVWERQAVFTGPAQVRRFLKQAREYAGSYEVLHVEKVAKDGRREYVSL